MSYTYLFLDLAVISIPLVFSFNRRFPFFKEWKYFLPALVVVAIPFIVWDMLFTNLGVWGFNPDYLVGVNLFNLPIEELLFFVCIPYASVFTFFSLQKLIPSLAEIKIAKSLQVSATVLLFAIGVITLDQWYTSITYLSLSISHGYLVFKNVQWLPTFYVSYTILLLPFFIVNGLLTGSFIEGEIVWYNDMHNFGIRLFTIPIEDVFYGMLLILLNVHLMEVFKYKRIW